MEEILLGIAIFTGLVMTLALIVLGARAAIWGLGQVRLSINGEGAIESPLGVKLLSALNNGGVYLPTSCGGAGTCGLCRVQVSAAIDGDALPIERAVISATDIANGYRLACQVVVRGDMNVTVPQTLLAVKNWQCTVRSTRTLSPLIKEIVLALPEGEEQHFAAGSYALVNAPAYKLSFSEIDIEPEHEATWQRLGLRNCEAESKQVQSRAYSLVNRPSDTDVLILNVRLALAPSASPASPPGAVSSYLFSLKEGDTVAMSGPYGNFFVKDTNREVVFIGGGVGMAPLYAHVHDQLERLKSQRTISYWYGARSVADLYYADEMRALAQKHPNFSWHVALSEPAPGDNWTGDQGFVHEAVYQKYLISHPAPQECEYYLCGPPLMVHAVRTMLDKLGVAKDNIFSDDFGA